MTLILTAICKDGICICSDKRYTEKFTNGKIVIRDDMHKVCRLKQQPIAIYNHGINRFDRVYWNELCTGFEAQNVNYKSFEELCECFIDYVHPDIVKGLKSNPIKDDKYAFFVICGRLTSNEQPQIVEYQWSKDNFQKPKPNNLLGFVRSGDGKKYVDLIIAGSSRDKATYWMKLKVKEASKKLESIFQDTVYKRQYDEFSDEYDIEVINC